MKREGLTNQLQFPVLTFTKVGTQLLELSERKGVSNYLNRFSTVFSNANISVQYCVINEKIKSTYKEEDFHNFPIS
ncbi:MAG: hypothetical protein CK427_17195 [Leptospira sp.]|nr:MAG: hypothetical protein CK427_17195 [Leptospira sp.]